MSFPATLDSFPSAATLAAHTLATDPHSTLHGNLGDAIAAIEAKVGIDGSAVVTSIDYLLRHLDMNNATAGVLSIGRGGTGAMTANTAFGQLSPLGALGDTLYHDGTANLRLDGNITATRKFLTQTGTGAVSAAPAWNTIAASDLPGSFAGFANPTASVGLSAVNGSAATAMRSDAAPALSQSIAPTWTGRHIFSLNGALSAPPVSITGTWITGGSATTTTPQALIEPSGTTSTGWSTSGTGLGINAAAAFAGNYLDCQVGGASKFNLSGSGALVTMNIAGGSGSANRLLIVCRDFSYSFSDGTNVGFSSGGGIRGDDIRGGSNGKIGFGDNANRDAGTLDTAWTRGGAAALMALTDGGTTSDTALGLRAKSSTTADRDRIRIATAAVDNTDATRKYRGIFSAYDTVARECLRIEASGTAAMLGFFGHTAAVQDAGWSVTNFTTRRTLDRSAYTLDQLADLVGTLIDTVLKGNYGLLAA